MGDVKFKSKGIFRPGGQENICDQVRVGGVRRILHVLYIGVPEDPELVQAVVSYVGIYDMLRVELSPNGAFNVTEFGTVQDREQFEALYSYSPYHNVIDGVSYPATLFLTGANDPRVDPMQSRKMTARLQAASTSDAPILLRTSANAGHGGGSSLDERIEQTVDVLAFLFQYLGITLDHSR